MIMKTYSLINGEENTIFVWSSFMENSFSTMPQVDDNMIVVITNASNPIISIYNTNGFNEEEKMDVVNKHCNMMSIGCNYNYECIRVCGNTYFCN